MITSKTNIPRVSVPLVEIFSELGTPILTPDGVSISEYITKFTYKQEQNKGGEVVVNIDIDDVALTNIETLQEGQWVLFHWGYIYSDGTYSLSPMVKVKISDMGAKFNYNHMQINFKGKDLVQELITISPVPVSTLDLYKNEHWINLFDNGLGKKVGVVIYDSIEGKLLYANKYSQETVETDSRVYSLLDTSVGDIGNNLLTQVKQKIQNLDNGPWYIDSISNMLYIHNESPVPSPNTPTYIYGGGINKEQTPSQEIAPEELLLSFSFDIKYVSRLVNTGGGSGIGPNKNWRWNGSGTVPTNGFQEDYHYIAFRYIDPLGDLYKIEGLLKKLAEDYTKGNVDDEVYAEVNDYYFNGRLSADRARMGKNSVDSYIRTTMKTKFNTLVGILSKKNKSEKDKNLANKGKNTRPKVKKSRVSQSSKGTFVEYDFTSVQPEWLTNFLLGKLAMYGSPIAGGVGDPNPEKFIDDAFRVLMGETNRDNFIKQLRKVVTSETTYIAYDKENGNPLNVVASYVTYIPASRIMSAIDAKDLLTSLELDANGGIGYSTYSIGNRYSPTKPRLNPKNPKPSKVNPHTKGIANLAINRLNTWNNDRVYYNSNYGLYYKNNRGYVEDVFIPVTVYVEQAGSVKTEDFYWKAFQFLRNNKYDPNKTPDDQRFDDVYGKINHLSATLNAVSSRQTKMVRERQETCEMSCIGNPNILVASSVNLLGVGRWSGIWGVKAIQHEISSSGYTCRMSLEKKQLNASYKASGEVELPVEK